MQRQRLAKLGFTSLLADLPADKADAFLVIDIHLDELREREAKKKGRARG